MSSFDFYKTNAQYGVFFLPFDGQYVNASGNQVVRNLGKVVNFSEDAICGDGTTSSTFPTQLPGKGLSFDGGDYIDLDWEAGGPLDTQTFTFLCHCKPEEPPFFGSSALFSIGSAGGAYDFGFAQYNESLGIYTASFNGSSPIGYPKKRLGA